MNSKQDPAEGIGGGAMREANEPEFNVLLSAFSDTRYSNPNEYIIDFIHMATDVVRVLVVSMPSVSEEEETLKKLNRFSGSECHQRGCFIASRWLEQQGRTWSSELKYLRSPGGIADVATTDGKLFVEVGSTSVGKVIDCLLDGCEVLMVPYTDDPDFATGFLLSPQPGYEEFAQELEERDRKAKIEAVERRSRVQAERVRKD